jgi:hypothetical protein
MKTIRLLIISTALSGLMSLPDAAATSNESDPDEIRNAKWQALVRDAVAMATNKDSKTNREAPLKIRLKDGTSCTLNIGRDRQARCIETGQAFTALVVQCKTMPQQLRARCEAAQSTIHPKER